MSSLIQEREKKNLMIMLVGPEGCGKTSILRKLMAPDDILDGKHKTTFGLDFRVKDILVNSEVWSLQIIDTASQINLQVDSDYYLTTADVIMYIYDISKEKKRFTDFYDGLQVKLKELKENASKSGLTYKNKYTVLVGNKSDEKRMIDFLEGQNMQEQREINLFFEVSALDGKYIQGLFESTANQYFDNRQTELEKGNAKGKNDLGNSDSEKRKCCIII